MVSRKWLFRSLFFIFLAALAGGALLLHAWMRPELIRAELTKQLSEKFNDVEIEVQSARLRLLGGISVNELKLYRRDDPTRTPWLQVPTAVLHHDKEQLNNGHLVIRKIELFKPRFRFDRDVSGKWNMTGLLKPLREDEIAPIFVLHDAVIAFHDRRFGEQPIAELRDIEATVINDPAPVFTFEARGTGRPSGPFTFDGRMDRKSGMSGSLDLSKIPLGGDLARLVEVFEPDAGELLKPLNGEASAHLDFALQTGAKTTLYHDLKVQLRQSRYVHDN
ncbi:MAG: DUF748 domain-containing protein [Planctomycetes bacterium]|nr:DUF748 domain-containing protein [Planctomycetota bacterium]